jgi:predicted TIM-barrel fold metal-dependent hydrolase
MKLFDAHLHIIDPRFALQPNNGYLPDPFTCADYHARMKNYDLCGGAVVSASFQGNDQNYLLDALQVLGPSFVGVTQLADTATDDEIMRLNTAGVRAIRFDFKRGVFQNLSNLEAMALRVYELCGWHAEFYVEAIHLNELYNTLIRLPAISIDHLGLTKVGFESLLKLVDKGAKVKASGFGRVDFNVNNALKQIFSINPQALMFATDLPSTRAQRIYCDDDFNLVLNAFSNDMAQNILYNNAVEFYNVTNLSTT